MHYIKINKYLPNYFLLIKMISNTSNLKHQDPKAMTSLQYHCFYHPVYFWAFPFFSLVICTLKNCRIGVSKLRPGAKYGLLPVLHTRWPRWLCTFLKNCEISQRRICNKVLLHGKAYTIHHLAGPLQKPRWPCSRRLYIIAPAVISDNSNQWIITFYSDKKNRMPS